MVRLAAVRKRREEAEKRKAEEQAEEAATKEKMEKAVKSAAVAAGPKKLNPLEVRVRELDMEGLCDCSCS